MQSAIPYHFTGDNWRFIFILGVVLSLIALIIIASPVNAAMALEVVIGSFLIIIGAAFVIHAVVTRNSSSFVFKLATGVLNILIGILILTHLLETLIALCWLLAVYLLVEGAFKMFLAFRLKKVVSEWKWMLVSSLFAVILGVIWIIWPVTAAWVLGLFVGLDILITGVILISLALSFRKKSLAEHT
jgi:uncharacterized membrane protein HdeD (DUF308 family)